VTKHHFRRASIFGFLDGLPELIAERIGAHLSSQNFRRTISPGGVDAFSQPG